MMNNKYEHSWKRIESLDTWSIPFSTPSSNWGEYLKCGDDVEASYQISEDLEIIKELVVKMTFPYANDKGGYSCRNCDNGVFYGDVYCSSCGISLGGGDE